MIGIPFLHYGSLSFWFGVFCCMSDCKECKNKKSMSNLLLTKLFFFTIHFLLLDRWYAVFVSDRFFFFNIHISINWTKSIYRWNNLMSLLVDADQRNLPIFFQLFLVKSKISCFLISKSLSREILLSAYNNLYLQLSFDWDHKSCIA